jgi:hypothetical protein
LAFTELLVDTVRKTQSPLILQRGWRLRCTASLTKNSVQSSSLVTQILPNGTVAATEEPQPHAIGYRLLAIGYRLCASARKRAQARQPALAICD